MFKAALVSHRRIALIVCLLLASGPAAARAQCEFPSGFSGLGGAGNSHEVTFEAQFTPAEADRPALLFVTAQIADGFYVYAVDQAVLPDNGGGPMATAIDVSANPAVRLLGPWQPIEPPHTHEDEEIWVGLELREHEKQVTWFAPIALAPDADVKNLSISVTVEGQSCNPQTCIPFEQTFTAELGPGVRLPSGIDISASVSSTQEFASPPAPAAESTPSNLQAGNDAPVTQSATAYDLSQIALEESDDQSFLSYLIMAFLGGLILNIMPCVLPVIGLKVMSFVQQAGQSRMHAWALNCWYAAGIISVFLVLASLAVSIQLGWGTQFSNATFNITLIGIVFAMALSMLGLWEIPIPGFVGGGAAMKAAEQEGPAAAFLKGVLTTLLATPCTGPFMATALAWAVKQPAWMTYSMFGVLGLGMASPTC